MRETPDGFVHLKVNVSPHHFVEEVILGDDPRRNVVERHCHVFISIKGCLEVKISDVEAHIPCIWHAEDAVPMDFPCHYVSCACGEFAWVVD